jgi:hypothetical protein
MSSFNALGMRAGVSTGTGDGGVDSEGWARAAGPGDA